MLFFLSVRRSRVDSVPVRSSVGGSLYAQLVGGSFVAEVVAGVPTLSTTMSRFCFCRRLVKFERFASRKLYIIYNGLEDTKDLRSKSEPKVWTQLKFGGVTFSVL